MIVSRDKKVFTSADLKKINDADYDFFMRCVFDVQVNLWIEKEAVYVAKIPASGLAKLPARDSLPGRDIRVHREIKTIVREMLREARRILSGLKAKDEKNARQVTDIRVRSAYRPAWEQLFIWERHYPKFYKNTVMQRQNLPGGEHGNQAVQLLAKYIDERVFSPGYSPHQGGKTIDFTYEENGIWAECDTSNEGLNKWNESWPFFWLKQNAGKYGFAQNPGINEPWHWEYTGG